MQIVKLLPDQIDLLLKLNGLLELKFIAEDIIIRVYNYLLTFVPLSLKQLRIKEIIFRLQHLLDRFIELLWLILHKWVVVVIVWKVIIIYLFLLNFSLGLNFRSSFEKVIIQFFVAQILHPLIYVFIIDFRHFERFLSFLD